MASLTTVYAISIILTSLAGIGSAFVGNKIYPLKGGTIVLPPTPADVKKATEEADKATSVAADKAAKLAASDLYQVKKAQEAEKEPEPPAIKEPEPQPEPQPETPTPKEPEPEPETPLQKAINDKFKMGDEFAKNVAAFIQTPVTLWNSIANTPQELRRKFVKTLSHPNLNKCPDKLLDICKIVNIKYSNMKDFIEENPYTPYGDQTEDALTLLSNIE